jgi:hypothetical protein
MHTDMDLRRSYSTDQMRKSDATMDRVLAKSRKMLKQKKGKSKLKTSTTAAHTLAVPEYLSPKPSREPEVNFTSSLHINSYGCGYSIWLIFILNLRTVLTLFNVTSAYITCI